MSKEDVKTELLACPFCGPGNSIPGVWFDDATQAHRVSCGACGSSTGFKPRWTEVEAIAAWNRRALSLHGKGGDANEVADFIRDQVCCPRPQGCEVNGAEECPAERVRALGYGKGGDFAGEDEIIREMCKAHDREVSAQKGKPSPWAPDAYETPGHDWEQERYFAMREAFDVALAALSRPTPEGGEAVDGLFLLVKRGLYYRPNAQGYTGIKDEAGRYSAMEAAAHADPASGVTSMLVSEAPDFSPNCADDVVRRHLERKLAALATPSSLEIAGLREALEAFVRAGGANPAIGKARFSVWSLDNLAVAFDMAAAALSASPKGGV